MLYAIVQKDLTPPSVELLRRAFRLVRFLTDLDAHTLAQDAYGILVRRLSQDNAAALQRALHQEGLETEMVPERDLPGMPQAKVVSRVDCTAGSLLVYDPIGRSFPVEWGHVYMIGAGKVRVNEFRTVETQRRRWASSSEADVEWVTERMSREERNERLLLEIILSGAVLRYSMNAERSNYAYLGERIQRTVEENFALLTRDLAAHAPHAAVNRGAYYLREHAAEPTAYPSKNAFFEELIWLLWRMRQDQT